jgi:1-acyl-sn-glycerol-3-phosphate acyltransferase
VHALTKREMFDGRTGHGLRAVGQIPLNRTGADPGAVKTCLRVLHDGGVVGIYPEGTRGAGEFHHIHAGVAYLALVSGAPVVPVVNFGTRALGGGMNSLPPRGGRIHFVYGAPVRVPQRRWPRTREQVRATSVLLHRELLAHLDRARAETGLDLPGPIADLSPDDALMTRPVSTKENLE